MTIFLGACALALGGVIGWLVARTKLQSEISILRAKLDMETASAREKIQLLQNYEGRLREVFDGLSADALRKNNESFLTLAETKLGLFQQTASEDLKDRQNAIEKVIAPVKESLVKFDAKLQELESARAGAQGALKEHLASMAQVESDLRGETANLVKALRQPHVRGHWGEMQLRRVVEMAGMLDRCDFYEQESKQTDEGRLRPDLLVRLPAGHTVVVDAKAPLSAYLESLESVDDTFREEELRKHSRQVRDHIAKLSTKSYWDQFKPTPEFVVMFLPGESFFSAALRFDPSLIEYGVEQKVIPASPTTLISLLRAVAYGWRQEAVAENAQRISELGKDLFDRIRVMSDHFQSVGKSLTSAVTAFNKAVASFETRVLPGARKFKDLGAVAEGDLAELFPVEPSPRRVGSPDLLVAAPDKLGDE